VGDCMVFTRARRGGIYFPPYLAGPSNFLVPGEEGGGGPTGFFPGHDPAPGGGPKPSRGGWVIVRGGASAGALGGIHKKLRINVLRGAFWPLPVRAPKVRRVAGDPVHRAEI